MFSSTKSDIHNCINELVSIQGYNLVIGGDGHADISKNNEIAASFSMSETPWTDIHQAVSLLPQSIGTALPARYMDPITYSTRDDSIFTFNMQPGPDRFGQVKHFTIGVYGLNVSAESTERNGLLVIKPAYTQK